MKTKFTELLGIEYPLVQGSMQYMSLAELASEVSNAGGLGLVPSMAFATADDLRAEVQKMKSLTDKPFGFNISLVPEVVIPEMIFEYIQVLIDEKVPVIETSGQRPGNFIKPIKEAGIPIIHKVTSVRHAKAAEADGADIVTIIGAEGGGHPGPDQVSGHILWAKAAEELSVPVLAAGGIVDGKSMYSAMSLGVDGVLMATRFLASKEINAPDSYKHLATQVPENGTVLTMKSLRNAMRVVNNKHAQKIIEAEKNGATLKELMPLISGRANITALQEERYDDAQMSVCQGIGRVTEVKAARDIVKEVMEDFYKTHDYMNQLLK